ncbi:MAG: cation diffusion facilitator family transporter [Eubacteriales bacterium]|nr:cation diffusion facilitator family transporter [Clostridiales bacterium]MDY5732026.1 cation diffusion facilitator family transporter [Eubacteriales bacterium]
MISLLVKLFYGEMNMSDEKAVRRAYGTACSGAGIGFNVLLFAGKLIAGMLSGSVAIVSDAFNNLSDAGSSIISLVGFKLSNKKSDPQHPFGHGRLEYISGLCVSFLIILMGVELGKASIEKIIEPAQVKFSLLTAAILAASILVKLYMALYNSRIGKRLNAVTMKAMAKDSLSDAVATGVVLMSMIVAKLADIAIDGYCGVVVAAFILFTGITAARDTISPLLGQKPDSEFIEEVMRIVNAHKEIIGTHDLVVHDYGPGRLMITLHAEVDASMDILVAHDAVDNIENELREKLGCSAVVHMDPIVTDDVEVNATREEIKRVVSNIDSRMTIHDFRMVPGPTHTNVIFDVAVPFDIDMDDDELRKILGARIRDVDSKLNAVIEIDKCYC